MTSQGNPVSLYGDEAQDLRYIAMIIFAYSELRIGQNGLHSIQLYAPLMYCTHWRLRIRPVLGKVCWPYYHL
jgi:hypothetical protein